MSKKPALQKRYRRRPELRRLPFVNLALKELVVEEELVIDILGPLDGIPNVSY